MLESLGLIPSIVKKIHKEKEEKGEKRKEKRKEREGKEKKSLSQMPWLETVKMFWEEQNFHT
jgi:hypothetical protein